MMHNGFHGGPRASDSHTTTSTRTLSIPSTASFSVSGDTVTETIVYGNVVETIQFVESDTAGLYAIASDTKTFIQAGSSDTVLFVDSRDRAQFSIDASGNVTEVQAVRKDGGLKDVSIGSSTTYGTAQI